MMSRNAFWLSGWVALLCLTQSVTAPTAAELLSPALAQPRSLAAPNTPGATNSGTTNLGSWLDAHPGQAANDQYKLRAGDKVSFQVLEDREPPKSLVVADSGELEVPCLGRIMALGKTCKELAGELKPQLEQDYYYRATVVIALEVANRVLGRVYVWGQVRNQGAIDLFVNEHLTAGQAILRAGGFADFANQKRVKLVRAPIVEGKEPQQIELNMRDILEHGKTDRDLQLRPDDLLIVPARLISF